MNDNQFFQEREKSTMWQKAKQKGLGEKRFMFGVWVFIAILLYIDHWETDWVRMSLVVTIPLGIGIFQLLPHFNDTPGRTSGNSDSAMDVFDSDDSDSSIDDSD